MPPDHPLRLIRAVVNEALDLAPEKLLRALYCIRSKRQLMEQRDRNLLFRWFVGLSRDGSVWNAGMFSKNRDRLLDGDVAQRLLAAVVAQPRIKLLMSPEHFSVDSTLIRAWATHKSVRSRPSSIPSRLPVMVLARKSDGHPRFTQAAPPNATGHFHWWAGWRRAAGSHWPWTRATSGRLHRGLAGPPGHTASRGRPGACRSWLAARLGWGRTHDGPCGRCRQPARAQKDRGGVRPDREICRSAAAQVSRPWTGWPAISRAQHCLQHDPTAETADSQAGMTAAPHSRASWSTALA